MSAKRLQSISPIVLGQKSFGFILSSILILVWQCAHAQAAVSPTGSNENDFFRLEWDYDLQNGTGQFIMTLKDPDDYTLYAGFIAFGLFTEVELDSLLVNGQPDSFGNVSQPAPGLFRYSFDNDFHTRQPVMQFDITFPKNNVQLFERPGDYFAQIEIPFDGQNVPDYIIDQLEFRYHTGHVPTRTVMSTKFPSTMNMVSVQAIPEPTTAVTLGLGAIVTASLCRRQKREMTKDKDN